MLATNDAVDERKMFGGLAFMVFGNMSCGVCNDGVLMLRLGEEKAAEALKEPHVRPMDFTGKPIKSMVFIDPPAIATDDGLQQWIQRALDFALTLPPK